MGCYLEDYWARVGTWVGRLVGLARIGESRLGDANQASGHCLVLIALSSTTLAVLLIIEGFEQNLGPVMEKIRYNFLVEGAAEFLGLE